MTFAYKKMRCEGGCIGREKGGAVRMRGVKRAHSTAAAAYWHLANSRSRRRIERERNSRRKKGAAELGSAEHGA